MLRRMRTACSAAVASTLLAGGTAMATAPGSTVGSQAPSQAIFGQSVLKVVQAALQPGANGTVLANAVQEVQLAERANANGLTVAMAVYARAESAAQGPSPFADVALNTPWAEVAIDALQQGGVVNGTSATTYDPGAPVTLAELATMLGRLQAGTAASTSDAPAGTPPWAQNGLAWVQESGVLNGEQNLGTPDTPLSREQAVLMLINAAGLGQIAATQSATPIDLQGTPPPWAHGAIALAIQLGLLQGSNGQLLADQPLTRAQMAVLLARLAVLEARASSG